MLFRSAVRGACGRTPWPWQRLPDLPLALAGQFAGVHDGALIVAGGSHFPVSKWEGGPKRWVDTIFVLTSPGARWLEFKLPRPLAYGGSVSTPRGLLLAGGGDEKRNSPGCLWLGWNGKGVDISSGPPLPEPLANCAAALLGQTAYLVGGQDHPTASSASRAVYALDVSRDGAEWRAAPELPAAGRILPSVAASEHGLFVAGGASLTPGASGAPARVYLGDAWLLPPGGGWRRLPDLPELTCAAPAFATRAGFFVLGGSDGVLAVRENELRDAHPGFSLLVKTYRPGAKAWTVASELPFSLVTTTPAVWRGQLVLPGGEDRPAHRSAAVYAVPLSQTTR